MNEIPCKNCNQLLEKHFIQGEDSNAENWCFPETGNDILQDSMYYEPMTNLEYLEYCYEKTL